MSKYMSADHNQMQRIIYDASCDGAIGPTHLDIGMEATTYWYLVIMGVAYQVVLGRHIYIYIYIYIYYD